MYQGEPLVKGKRVTGFTNGEEAAMKLTEVVPFLVEDELKRIGGLCEKAADWAPFALLDGGVVTGQNPASSTTAAKALVELLAARKAAWPLKVRRQTRPRPSCRNIDSSCGHANVDRRAGLRVFSDLAMATRLRSS